MAPIAILVFIIILSVLVVIHELGHFLMARKFGVDVEEFGVGIPPKLWGKRFGKVLFSINALPFGGFVRIKGEDFTGYDPKDKGNFINKKPFQKIIILAAGIVMNTILAVVIFYVLLATNGYKASPILVLNDYHFRFGETEQLPNVITFVRKASPAEKAGIQFADRIVKLSYMGDVTDPRNVQDIRSYLSDKSGKSILVSTKNINSGQKSEYIVVPELDQKLGFTALGVGLDNAVQLSYQTPLQKISAGFLHSANVMDYSLNALSSLVKVSIKKHDMAPVSQGIAGPVGIFGAVRSILDNGGNRTVTALLDLTAVLSLSFAFMNLLPIPALDGGRLAFVLTEVVTHKKPSAKLESKAHQIGFIFLILLLVVITFKDIKQFF